MTDDQLISAFQKLVDDIRGAEILRQTSVIKKLADPGYQAHRNFQTYNYPYTPLGEVFRDVEDSGFLMDVKVVLNMAFWSGSPFTVGTRQYKELEVGVNRIYELRDFHTQAEQEPPAIQAAIASLLPDWEGPYAELLPIAKEIAAPKQVGK